MKIFNDLNLGDKFNFIDSPANGAMKIEIFSIGPDDISTSFGYVFLDGDLTGRAFTIDEKLNDYTSHRNDALVEQV